MLKSGLAAGMAAGAFAASGMPLAARASFEITHTDAQWRALLSPEACGVLRKSKTEAAFSSPLNNEHRVGIFACAGCDLALYSSQAKYDSGTGWPSFWKPLENAVATRKDRSLFTTGPKFTVAVAAAIWAMCSAMGPSPPASAGV